MLKEAVPTASRIAILWNPDNPLHTIVLQDTQVAAQQLGVQLQSVEVHSPTDLEGAFAAMTLQHADALTVAPDAFFVLNRTRIAELAIQHQLPAIYLHTEHVHAGDLMAYGPNYHDLFRRAATYVDKRLSGNKAFITEDFRSYAWQG
jgi:putative ABC transport system substrate-binding protein